MGREPRVDVEGGWHHVMNRGVARQPTFHDDADRVEFGRLLGVGHDRFGVEVHAYCLMPNHYHLLLHCPDRGLSDFMQMLSSVYTRHANDRLGRDGPLFRGRFRSITVSDDRQLLATVRYIHRNPLDLAGVADLTSYRWSSHRTYLGHRRCPPWLRTNDVLDHFGGDTSSFHRFVTPEPTSEGPALRHGGPLTATTLLAAIELIVSEMEAELATATQGLVRTITVLLADSADHDDVCTAATELLATPQGVSKDARGRARRRAAHDPGLLTAVERVRRLVG